MLLHFLILSILFVEHEYIILNNKSSENKLPAQGVTEGKIRNFATTQQRWEEAVGLFITSPFTHRHEFGKEIPWVSLFTHHPEK